MAALGVTRAGWREALRRFAFRTSEYNKLGLLRDDILDGSPEIDEAVRRLPRKIKEERQFRRSRALYLSMRKEVLPVDEWTKYEEDVRYLKPFMEEVEKEFIEREEWNKK